MFGQCERKRKGKAEVMVGNWARSCETEYRTKQILLTGRTVSSLWLVVDSLSSGTSSPCCLSSVVFLSLEHCAQHFNPYTFQCSTICTKRGARRRQPVDARGCSPLGASLMMQGFTCSFAPSPQALWGRHQSGMHLSTVSHITATVGTLKVIIPFIHHLLESWLLSLLAGTKYLTLKIRKERFV